MGEKIVLKLNDGESAKDSLFREFGWLLNPLIEKTKSFDAVLNKLNWKIVEKYQ
jgi:hypothetical protein